MAPSDVKFSVLMPTKGRPTELRRAVEAVLLQDHWNFELIIKDGGEWGALDIPEDDRIVYLHSRDRGLADALVMAGKLATGSIWHIASDDDQMEPGALAHVANAWDWGNTSWTYGRVDIVDERGKFMFEGGTDRVLPASVYWRDTVGVSMMTYLDDDEPDMAKMWQQFSRHVPGKDCKTVLARKFLRPV